MTCSTSSSSRIAAVALAAWVAGCAGSRPPPVLVEDAGRPRLTVLVLPPENLNGGPLPIREWTGRIERLVAMAGADVVGGERLDDYLARYRIRYTGGVDAGAARAAREDLSADVVLVTSVELAGEAPPRVAVTMRLVGTSPDTPVLWMDGFSRAGDENPGLLGLGLRFDYPAFLSEALGEMQASLEGYLSGRVARAAPCSPGGWFRPRVAYRARPDERPVSTVAVLPFVNQTRRRGAGEIAALGFARQIAVTDGFRLLEPGTVRDELLRRRIVMEDGVSLDQARMISATMEADLVMAGYVFDYEDAAGPPFVNFTVLVIDRKTGRIVWESTSYNRGTDSESLFGINTVGTAPMLTCRMAREAVDGMRGARALAGPR